MTPTQDTALGSIDRISHSILEMRGYRIILDRDLAAIYGVTTGRLNEAVKRNAERFPQDFMFRLTREEVGRSRSQVAILKRGRGYNMKYLPHAFTEHGAIQAANVLSSPRAVMMGIQVVRAFVQLRGLLASNREVAEKLMELERKLATCDQAIAGILKVIQELLTAPTPTRRGIGFTADISAK